MKHLYGLIPATPVVALPAPLAGISVGKITAVVRDTPITDYRTLPQEELLHQLAAHQQTIETLLAQTTLLPVQFGAPLPDEATIKTVLRDHAPLLSKTLQELAGLVQMEVIVSWESEKILHEIATELNIATRQAQLTTPTAAEARATQIAVGREVHLILAQRQDALEQLVMQMIAPLAKGLVKNPQMDEEMVVNLGVLLPATAVADLEQILETIDHETNQKYHIRCLGPRPAHSFAQLNIYLPPPEQVEQARQLLHLAPQTTATAIKKAYHTHDHYTQPDHNPDFASSVKMTELAQAYKLLQQIAQAQGGQTCDLSPARVAQTVLVSLSHPSTML